MLLQEKTPAIIPKTLDSDLETAMDVSNMLFNLRFDMRILKPRKMLLLEEIGMYESYPEKWCMICWRKRSGRQLFRCPSLGILIHFGYYGTIFWNMKLLCPESSVISVAGNFDEYKH